MDKKLKQAEEEMRANIAEHAIVIKEMKMYPVNEKLVDNIGYRALMKRAETIRSKFEKTRETRETMMSEAEKHFESEMLLTPVVYDTVEDFKKDFGPKDAKKYGLTMGRAMEIVEFNLAELKTREHEYMAGGSHNLTGAGGFPKEKAKFITPETM